MKRIIEAVQQYFNQAEVSVEAHRLFHGRGHCYPGLEDINVDYYAPLVLITLYKEPDPSVSELLAALEDQPEVEVLMLQRRYLPRAPTEVMFGELVEPHYAVSDGLRYRLNLGSNQNIGFFIDMQPCHRWLKQQSEGLRLLNLFSYTCAFSVAAVAGGARQVVNVDMAGGALKSGQHNHGVNQLEARASRFMKLDILKSWGRIKKTGPFDLLIIDPPSNQRGSFRAESDYAKVLRRIPELLAPGGRVLACLNAPHLPEQFLIDAMTESCPDCQFVERMARAENMPERDEDCSLKTLLFQYRPES